MKKIVAAWLALAFFACGCATVTHSRLDQAEPDALQVSKLLLSPEQRRAAFEAHRGYANDWGLQIGRRHMDGRNLARYFSKSGLEPFARDAESLEAGREAKDTAGDIGEGFHSSAVALMRGGGSSGGSEMLVFLAGALAIDLVGVVLYEGWRAAAETELKTLNKKSEAFKGTGADLMQNYNQWLAAYLGVSPTAAALSPIKPFPPPWPVSVSISANAEKGDWKDEYRLESVGRRWYFGGREVDSKEMLLFYGPENKEKHSDVPFKSFKESDVSAFNKSFRDRMFPPPVETPWF